MKVSLYFKYGNISVIVRGTLFRLQLLKRSSHMELSLVCIITHQRSPQELRQQHSGRNTSTDSSGEHRVHNSYYTSVSEAGSNWFQNGKTLSAKALTKIHTQIGHASATRMKSFNWEVHERNQLYDQTIDRNVKNCA